MGTSTTPPWSAASTAEAGAAAQASQRRSCLLKQLENRHAQRGLERRQSCVECRYVCGVGERVVRGGVSGDTLRWL